MNATRGDDNLPDLKSKGGFAHNPVYHGENPNLEAECIYFYRLLGSGHNFERYFVDLHRPILRGEMPEEMATIMDDIRSGALQPNTSPNEWKRKSYFAVVLDDTSSELEEGNAVEFDWQGGGGNHTFRDGEDVRSLRVPHSGLTGFFCFNHMKHRHGHVLGEREREEFRVRFQHPHAVVAAAMWSHEDSGTNLGPPIPPPP